MYYRTKGLRDQGTASMTAHNASALGLFTYFTMSFNENFSLWCFLAKTYKSAQIYITDDFCIFTIQEPFF